MSMEDIGKPPNASTTTLAAITQPASGIGTLAQKREESRSLAPNSTVDVWRAPSRPKCLHVSLVGQTKAVALGLPFVV